MTRGLGLGAKMRLIRVAGAVPGSSFYEVTRANWEYGSQSDVLLVRLARSPPAPNCAEITASLVLERCP